MSDKNLVDYSFTSSTLAPMYASFGMLAGAFLGLLGAIVWMVVRNDIDLMIAASAIVLMAFLVGVAGGELGYFKVNRQSVSQEEGN